MSRDGAADPAIPTLAVEGLRAGYDRLEVLHAIDLTVHAGEIVAVIGANGAGKSTLLRAVSGLLRPSGGRVLLAGREVGRYPAERLAGLGVAHVPEGRLVFPSMSVRENLLLGGNPVGRRAGSRRARAQASSADIDRMVELFPRLRPRLRQAAGSLSGGEQQMLAIGRGLMARPSLLLLDEPSLGLAPKVAKEIFGTLRRLHGAERPDGTGPIAMVLVEQNAKAALGIADRAYLLDRGRVALAGTARELVTDDRVRGAYLGGGYGQDNGGDREVAG